MTEPAQPTSGSLNRFAYVDAVRGLAFLGVLACHIAPSVGRFVGRGLLSAGNNGVQFFFLASAVTLCYSMESRSRKDRRPVVSFFIRRFFRIAPLFWLGITFYGIFPGVIPTFLMEKFVRPAGVRPLDYALAAVFLHGWFPYSFTSIVPGGWSISDEMNFYLLFPLLFWFMGRSMRRAAWAALLGVVCLDLLLHVTSQPLWGVPAPIWAYFRFLWLPAQIPVFLLGFLVYHLTRGGRIQAVLRREWVAWGIVASLLFYLVASIKGFGIPGLPYLMAVSLCLGALIVALSGGALRLAVNRVTCHIGQLSYSCYLIHFACVGFFFRLFHVDPRTNGNAWNSGNQWVNATGFVVLFVLSLLLTLLVAEVSRRLIEEPGIQFGKRLVDRINNRAASA